MILPARVTGQKVQIKTVAGKNSFKIKSGMALALIQFDKVVFRLNGGTTIIGYCYSLFGSYRFEEKLYWAKRSTTIVNN